MYKMHFFIGVNDVLLLYDNNKNNNSLHQIAFKCSVTWIKTGCSNGESTHAQV